MNSAFSDFLAYFSNFVDLVDFLLFMSLLVKKNPSDQNKDKDKKES